MNKKLEAELEEWADLAETHPQRSLDKTEKVDVKLHLKRERVLLSLAPHVVEALKQKAKEEGKSINQIIERWLTEKLFIGKKEGKQE